MLPQVKDEVEQALINSALMVERDAKINAPVDTGRLRASITHVTSDFGTKNPSVEVGTSVNILPKKNRANTVNAYVEIGTSLCYN